MLPVLFLVFFLTFFSIFFLSLVLLSTGFLHLKFSLMLERQPSFGRQWL